MKRIILTTFTLISVLAVSKVSAQNQLKIGIGDGMIYNDIFEITDGITDIMGNIFTNQNYHTDTDVSVPYLFVDYRFSLSETVNLGAQVGYLGLKSTTTVHDTDGNKLSEANTKSNVILVMPAIDVRYFKANKFKMYGNLMAGVGFTTSTSDGESDSGSGFVFQVNPIGLSYGEKTSVFLEAGIGASIFNGGVSFTF